MGLQKGGVFISLVGDKPHIKVVSGTSFKQKPDTLKNVVLIFDTMVMLTNLTTYH